MSRRDRFSIRPGLPSSDANGSPHLPAPPMKATPLVHRLRDAGPNIRLVRDEVDISEEAIEAATRSKVMERKFAAQREADERDHEREDDREDEREDRREEEAQSKQHHDQENNTRQQRDQRNQRSSAKPISKRFQIKGRPASTSAQSITDPMDPRWVLALRTSESLQGTILGPEKRERLIKVGKMMGLTAFDANLVIAIVQDQARRGYAPEYCPTAGEAQLAMVPLPKRDASDIEARTRRIGIICGIISVLIGVELVVLKWLFS